MMFVVPTLVVLVPPTVTLSVAVTAVVPAASISTFTDTCC